MSIFLTKTSSWSVIFVSFLVALIFTVLHLPSWIEWVYPEWLVITVLYWAFVMPQRVNVGIAWLVGVFLDMLYNAPIGEHALALVLVIYFVIKFGEKIRLLCFWKKAVVVFSLIISCQLLPALMQVYLGGRFCFWSILSRAIASTLIWLIIVLLFDYKRRLYFESYY
ncbi:MAG: hypothetical protein ACD_21C00015G0004 [uncultured bacterium]|nr:MAG: hypothetical protein ACD_21C00015G0004 [uncultured bacterium]